MKASGMNGAAISRSIGRSKTVVNNFLKNPSKYGKCKCTHGDQVYFQSGRNGQFFDEHWTKTNVFFRNNLGFKPTMY